MNGTLIREFENLESNGVPFPKNQPMRIYSSLRNADDWAIRGGLVKTDWAQAPFTALYRNFNAMLVFGPLGHPLVVQTLPLLHLEIMLGYHKSWIQ